MNGAFDIFARFHARAGRESEVAEALRDQIAFVRTEPGCVFIDAFRSTRDPRLFFIHSRWHDETALEAHAHLPNTTQFIERMEMLIDHPFDSTRTQIL